MKKIKMKDTILSHYQKVHELEMDGFTVRVFKPRTMQQLPAHKMLEWIKFRADDAISYMVMEQKADWQLGDPDYGMWNALAVYHYDPHHKAFDIYIAAILIHPFSREACETYCRMHESIDDVNQQLMLMWDSREFDRIGGYDTSYGAYKDQKKADAIMYTVNNEDADIEDMSPDFYHDGETQQPGLTLKFKHDGDQVKSSASWPKHDPALVMDMPERMGTCGEEFVKFTEAHPEIKEMRFYTEPTEWEEDENEEN
jgi:hypothetical protein